MMDLGTMQQKVDDGEYRGMEELEVGLLFSPPLTS